MKIDHLTEAKKSSSIDYADMAKRFLEFYKKDKKLYDYFSKVFNYEWKFSNLRGIKISKSWPEERFIKSTLIDYSKQCQDLLNALQDPKAFNEAAMFVLNRLVYALGIDIWMTNILIHPIENFTATADDLSFDLTSERAEVWFTDTKNPFINDGIIFYLNLTIILFWHKAFYRLSSIQPDEVVNCLLDCYLETETSVYDSNFKGLKDFAAVINVDKCGLSTLYLNVKAQVNNIIQEINKAVAKL